MGNLFNSVSDLLGDGISSVLDSILYATVYKLLYYIEVGLCWLVKVIYSMFEVVAGISQVSYNGSQMFLINVFFSDDTVSKVYWGMAIIGMALCFGFAIVAVIRKTFDIGDKIKSSFGSILTQLGKSILIICSMTLIMNMILYSTNILMQQVTYIFNSSQVDTGEAHITYDDTDYAAMARIFNTIGNYSLNSSYQNRYNINTCYNEIRSDLQYLSKRGVFDVYYNTKDTSGNTVVTWQSALQTLAAASDPEKELPLDTYNESVTRAVTSIMELLRTDNSFAPLQSYDVQAQRSNTNVKMDTLTFLMGTFEAAKNPVYNEKPSVTDTLRAAYYDGDKDIYDLDTVSQDFDIGLGATNYVLVGLVSVIMLWNLVIIIFNCVARIYNMMLLYIIAPPVIAASPLDDGGKLKQWITAMAIQSLGVFGTVIAMRLLILFLPIVLSSDLVLLDNVLQDAVCKTLIIVAAFHTVKKGSGMLTGILSDNAAFASTRAADNSRAGAAFASGAAVAGLGAAGVAGKAAMAPARWAGRKATAPIRRALNGYRALRASGGLRGSGSDFGGMGSSGGYGSYGGGGANWMNHGAMATGGGTSGSAAGGPTNLGGGGASAGGSAANMSRPSSGNMPNVSRPGNLGAAGGGQTGGGSQPSNLGGAGGSAFASGGPSNLSGIGSSAASGGESGGSASVSDGGVYASSGPSNLSGADGSAFASGGPSNLSGVGSSAASGGEYGGSASVPDGGANASSGPSNLSGASSGAVSGASGSFGGSAGVAGTGSMSRSGSGMPGGSSSGGVSSGGGNAPVGGSSSAASGGGIPNPPPMRQNIPKPPPMPRNLSKK